MEIFIICLLSLTLIVLFYLLYLIKHPSKNDQKEEVKEIGSELKIALANNIGELKEHFALQSAQNNEKQQLNYQNFTKEVNANLEKGLDKLNTKVDERLNTGFTKTTETFEGLIERITKIDEAQKKLESLGANIMSLQDVLSDKKSRGCFGEVQLHTILSSIFGDKNDKIYELQYKLLDGYVVDAILHCPSPLGNLCIDSKFPLENYRKMNEKELSNADRQSYERLFRQDCKKHIDDIAEKYIRPGETSDQAILFLPAEAIFAYLNAHLTEVVTYANSKRVWITSPTTLMATLTTLQVILRNIERDKHAKEIQDELGKLAQEFGRYKERWDKFARTIDTISSDAKNIHTTTEKITKRFDSIQKVELGEIENDNLNELVENK